jgi:hypothetical protein
MGYYEIIFKFGEVWDGTPTGYVTNNFLSLKLKIKVFCKN